jgi:valyl-tRNA synthetase
VADWYIEASKSQDDKGILGHVLENVLKLTHPFAPFVTETIWQTLYSDTDSLLISSSWPQILKADAKSAEDFEQLRTIVTEARALVRSLELNKPNLYYTDVPFLAENAEVLSRLAGLSGVHEVSSGTGLQLTTTPYRCWLEVDSSTLRAYADKLAAQIASQQQLIAQLQGRLGNKNYVHNAPKHIVAETRQQLEEAQAAIERLRTEQARFQS